MTISGGTTEWKLDEIRGKGGQLHIVLLPDGRLRVAFREYTQHCWGPPAYAEPITS